MNYLEEYLEIRKKQSDNSHKTCKNILNKFFNKVQKEPKNVKRIDVKNYLSKEVDTWNVKYKTKLLHYQIISAFYSFLTEELNEIEIAFINPVPKKYGQNFSINANDFEDEDDRAKKVLSIEQLEQILDYTRKNRPLRDFILIALQICTGARISEIRTIRIEDINLEEYSFKTGIEKNARKSSKHGKKKLKFIFPKNFKMYLEYYMNMLLNDQIYLFTGGRNNQKPLSAKNAENIYYRIRKQKTGYKRTNKNGKLIVKRFFENRFDFDFTSHYFRHSIITHLANNGCPSNISNNLLNHKLQGMQERIYKHTNRLKDYSKYFPYYSIKYF